MRCGPIVRPTAGADSARCEASLPPPARGFPGQQLAARIPALWPQVDHPIGGADQVQMVPTTITECPASTSRCNSANKRHIRRVQAGRLIQRYSVRPAPSGQFLASLTRWARRRKGWSQAGPVAGSPTPLCQQPSRPATAGTSATTSAPSDGLVQHGSNVHAPVLDRQHLRLKATPDRSGSAPARRAKSAC